MSQCQGQTIQCIALRFQAFIAKNYETLIINRGKNENIVVMSLDEYNSLIATSYELSSKKNEIRLDSAIEKLNKGKSLTKDLIEE